ncbi:rRNA maturation RNase YbeY [Rubripirellula reticaptiva]|uniref:Endoribonuclease YbeY n=1 Tax=Rubripirellula reticaptiva TaxID=2528013 RepID=A0A5C6EK95_9BACT|nr:rRNA maturation RNase YbeY [Rubripirellula reticaptiva]TWU48041.1 Endoribonuclease YbeY [Rubripirellula reticaptiva]
MSNTPDNNRLDAGDDLDADPFEMPPSLDGQTSNIEVASKIEVEVNVDPQISVAINQPLMIRAIATAAAARGFTAGQIGVRVTDDPAIREINAKHLGHDYATDVISFGYEADSPYVEGELVVSIDTAISRAAELGWPAESELILYVVHGTLHICGMDDHDDDDRQAMRTFETEVMTRLGIPDIQRFGADTENQIESDIEITAEHSSPEVQS